MRFLRLLLPPLTAAATFAAAVRYQDQSLPEGRTPESLFGEDIRTLQTEAPAPEPAEKTSSQPNILLIVLDTVRADHLGVYGYPRHTSPRIDAWAKDARIQTRMMADGPWTLPSHGSLFTGLPPREHGAHGTPLGARALASALSPEVPTLAERLAEAGYRTGAIAANQGFLDSSWGLHRGFELYLCEQLTADPRGLGSVTGDRITALAQRYLAQHDSRPTFLFLNYMDAHSPWIPRKGYVAEPRAIRRSLLPGGSGWVAAQARLMGGRTHDPEAEAAWKEAYDAGIRYLDEQVGELLSQLPSLGFGPEDIVILLSDHGEYLGEHELLEHSKDLYQPVLAVPMLSKGLGPPGRDDQLTQLSDVSTLLLKHLGLAPLAEDTEPDLAVSELYWTRWKDLRQPYGQRFNRIRRAFRTGEHVLILGSDGSVEAYDLSTDPGQEHPLDQPLWLAPLKAAAVTWEKTHLEAAFTMPAKGGDMEALKLLGYMQ